MKFGIYVFALFLGVNAFDHQTQTRYGTQNLQHPNEHDFPSNSTEIPRIRRDIDIDSDKVIEASFALGGIALGFVPGGSELLTVVETVYNIFKEETSVWSQIKAQVRSEIARYITQYHLAGLADKLDYYGRRLKEFALEGKRTRGENRADFIRRLRAFYENKLMADENTFDPTRRSSAMIFNIALFRLYTAHVMATKASLALLIDQCNHSRDCNSEQYRRWLSEKERKWIQFATVTGPAKGKSLYFSKESLSCVYQGKSVISMHLNFACTDHRGVTGVFISWINTLWATYQFDADQIYSVMTKPVQALAGRPPSQITAMITAPNLTTIMDWLPMSRSNKQCIFFCREYGYGYKWCALGGGHLGWDYCDDD